MPISGQADSQLVVSAKEAHKLLGQKSKNENDQPEQPMLTPRQQRKQDALELAELVYDIFKGSESGVNIHGASKMDSQNV